MSGAIRFVRLETLCGCTDIRPSPWPAPKRTYVVPLRQRPVSFRESSQPVQFEKPKVREFEFAGVWPADSSVAMYREVGP